MVAATAACRVDPAPIVLPPTPVEPAEFLYIGLSSSASGFAELISDHYASETDRAVVQFITANNQTLLADMERQLLDARLVHTIESDSPEYFSPVALDGLVIITHPENPVKELNVAKIKELFGGRLDNWADIGGSDLPITLISRESGSGARTIFEERVMNGQRLAATARIAAGDAAMRNTILTERGAIGYSMMANTGELNVIQVDEVAPNPGNTADQSYLYTTPLYFVSPEEPSGELRAFLAWLQSPAGQEIIGENYGRVR